MKFTPQGIARKPAATAKLLEFKKLWELHCEGNERILLYTD